MIRRVNFLVVAAIAILAVAFAIAFPELRASAHHARVLSDRTNVAIVTLKDLDIALLNAETGQRGFVLTGRDDYLLPYQAAIARIGAVQGQLRRELAGDTDAQQDLSALAPLIANKLAELARTVALRRGEGFAAAEAVVENNSGRQFMRQIDTVLSDLSDRENAVLQARLAETNTRGFRLRLSMYVFSAISAVALVFAAIVLNLALRRAGLLEQEQRALAGRLRTSLDSLSQGVGVFDAGLGLTDWNHCFEDLLSCPAPLLVPGTAYAAFAAIAGKSGAPLLQSVDQIEDDTRAGTGIVTSEAVAGDGRHLELRRSPMPDGGFVITLSDMSKRAAAEAVLRESQKMQAIGQLTGGIAHDFNNLLTVILGNLEFTRAKLATQPDLALRLERAVSAAQRGATLTSQLLAFARRQPLAPAAIDLAQAMPDLVPLLQRTLGEPIDVRFVGAAGLWPAMADAAQLEAAVLNLALNARDAMPEGGRLTIEIANKVLDAAYAQAHSEVTAGDYVMVGVSDTGHGMTPEVMARVFEPFFTTKPDGRGTGLGLAMVFGFVKQSGGHVKMYSEPGEGTTVRLYLPRALRAPAAQRIDQPAVVPRGSATVLVVEDEAAVREIAVTILRDLGYRVLEAGDAQEALRCVDGAPEIDLLLTDVVLPGQMRGRDLADTIVQARPSVHVLFMSGYTENAIVHHGRLDDGVNFIAKPFKREQLAQKVASVLSV